MRPAVVTAVLMLVCVLGTQSMRSNTLRPKYLQTVDLNYLLYPQCENQPAEPCGDGWSRIDDDRCVTLIGTRKTFSDAEEHCRTLNSDLVSVHSHAEMIKLLCLTWYTSFYDQTFWIGAQRAGAEFRNTDGSEFNYSFWYPGEPDNTHAQEACVDSSRFTWGLWNVAPCSEEKFFVCAKKM